ncbi:5,10-methylene tetrahydromethanopterin reductase [Methanomassiliicoccales archaeon RumEn M1]|jgi:coenzyme F420-dependent glucose-6-phosphate dehydrogenase|nr:5,10-methylene tetrahydromethanopterin reductase [Methanomassiliicoccales archaeon RumEn M1]
MLGGQGAGGVRIGYHCSHEQFPPSTLLRLVARAERAGFNAALSSDHFKPWSERNAESGYAWSFLGAAMHATSIPFGVVCAPGQRYHPAVVAQGVATLEEMFPGRFWVALGSGQLLNEGITGQGWPPKDVLNERLAQSAMVIKRLLRGEEVTHRGPIRVERARLYTRPRKAPPVLGAAQTEATAELIGRWADGMITTSRPPEQLRGMIEAFRRGGGEGRPIVVKCQISYSRDGERADREAWEQWRIHVLPSTITTGIEHPEQFDALSRTVRREDVREKVFISSDADEHVEMIRRYLEMGITDIYLHNVSLGQEEFIDDFGRKVLPLILDG